MKNKSYLINQIEWYFTEYQDEGWAKDSDALDGDMALSVGGSSSRPVTASGKETANTKGSVIPVFSRREIIAQMDRIKRDAPQLYGAAEFVFTGTADDVLRQVAEAKKASDALLEVLCKNR